MEACRQVSILLRTEAAWLLQALRLDAIFSVLLKSLKLPEHIYDRLHSVTAVEMKAGCFRDWERETVVGEACCSTWVWNCSRQRLAVGEEAHRSRRLHLVPVSLKTPRSCPISRVNLALPRISAISIAEGSQSRSETARSMPPSTILRCPQGSLTRTHLT